MFEEYIKILNHIKDLPDADKGTARTAFICWCLAKIIYYVVAGVVTWALGRRIIQAVFAALRESKRSA